MKDEETPPTVPVAFKVNEPSVQAGPEFPIVVITGVIL